MSIDTTLHLDKALYDRIIVGSTRKGQSATATILNLLRKFIGKHKSPAPIGMAVRYQRRNDDGGWARVHIWLRDDEYEWIVDMRKVFKVSVSGIVAIAAGEFLEAVLNDKTTDCDTADNYHFRNYILAKEIVGGVVCWKLFWGFPPPETLITGNRIFSPT